MDDITAAKNPTSGSERDCDTAGSVPVHYAELGDYSDWPALTRSTSSFAGPDPTVTPRHRVAEVFGLPQSPSDPAPRVESRWTDGDLAGETISWSSGCGPRTQSWLVRPAYTDGPLPGVLALFDHGGCKVIGKEKIADGPDAIDPALRDVIDRSRAKNYGGRAVVADLARRGYSVLCHDVFAWGSRRFPLSAMTSRSRRVAEGELALRRTAGRKPDELEIYDIYAAAHEPALAKIAGVLGTSLGGMILREDLIALNYLCGRSDTAPGGALCFGFSGGGARSALLSLMDDRIRGTVVTAMMGSLPDMLDHQIDTHSWMWMTPGLGRLGDWPAIVATRAPHPLFVQYALDDELFNPLAMHHADEILRKGYKSSGAPDAYRSRFYQGPHTFSLEMQQDAWDWFDLLVASSGNVGNEVVRRQAPASCR